MSVSRLPSNGITRRRWTALLAATPLVAQVSPAPPPASPTQSSTPEQRLEKAETDIRQLSERLRQIQIPINIEPAFSFKA